MVRGRVGPVGSAEGFVAMGFVRGGCGGVGGLGSDGELAVLRGRRFAAREFLGGVGRHGDVGKRIDEVEMVMITGKVCVCNCSLLWELVCELLC